MKYLNFTVQTILFASALIFSSLSIASKGILILVLVIQLLLGSWQFVSSFYSVLRKRGAHKQKKFHFLLSCIYLITFFTCTVYNLATTWQRTFVVIGVIGIPWLLAIYYYILTWRVTFSETKIGNRFLPHTSF